MAVNRTIARLRGRVLVAGRAAGPLLRLAAPISFWGGVDPESGRVSDPRHPDHGAALAGRVVALPGTVGSSSSSAVMLELLLLGRAPAALLLAEADAILALGVVVAAEMGYAAIPVLRVAPSDLGALPAGVTARISRDGRIRCVSG